MTGVSKRTLINVKRIVAHKENGDVPQGYGAAEQLDPVVQRECHL